MVYTEYFVQIRQGYDNNVVAIFENQKTITGAIDFADWVYNKFLHRYTYHLDECVWVDNIWKQRLNDSLNKISGSDLLYGLTIEIMKQTHIDDDDTSEQTQYVKTYSSWRNKL